MELTKQNKENMRAAAAMVAELQCELEESIIKQLDVFEQLTGLKVVSIDVHRFDGDEGVCQINLDARTRECR